MKPLIKLFTFVLLLQVNIYVLNAASTLLYLPSNYDGSSQAEDITDRPDFEPICVNPTSAESVRLPGIDAVRGFAAAEKCPLSSEPVGPLNREVDTIFLIDDTSELSNYLVEAMSQRNGLQTLEGRQVISPTFVNFEGEDEESLSVLVVGEMLSRNLSDETQWLNRVNEAINSPSTLVPGGATGLECSVQPSLGGQCWTTEDVIDQRIEPKAQSVLMGMLNSSDSNSSHSASSMLCAVKEEKLDGIYLPSRQLPAQRSRAAGGNYWTMITPATKNATCYKQPEGENPLMVYRERIQDQASVLKSALQSSWAECEIPETVTRCYRETIVRPISAGEGNLIVEVITSDAGTANFGIVVVATKDAGTTNSSARTQNGIATLSTIDSGTYTISVDGCELGYGVEVVNNVEITGESKTIRVNISKSPECSTRPDPVLPGIVEECESRGMCNPNLVNSCATSSNPLGMCIPNSVITPSGRQCGQCTDSTYNLCVSQATDIYKRKTQQCDENEKTEFVSCIPDMLKCASSPGLDCLNKCMIGGPSLNKNSCGGRAMGDYQLALRHCKQRAALGN